MAPQHDWLDEEIPLPFDPPPSRGEMAPEGSGGRRELIIEPMRGREGTGGDRSLVPSSHESGDRVVVHVQGELHGPAMARADTSVMQGRVTQAASPTPHGRLAACLSSDKVEWGTPPAFFHALDQEFHFLTDLAASPTNTCLDNWLGPLHQEEARRDALAVDWWRLPETEGMFGGFCWLNPPYGRTLPSWLQKCHMTAQQGIGVVTLLPARTDTRWFHTFCIGPEIRFIEGRLHFVGAENGAPFPSMVVVFRPQVEGGLRGMRAVSWHWSPGGRDERRNRREGLRHALGDAPFVPTQ